MKEEQSAEVRPRVSIVIPVYNAEQYLRECLDSVLSQTLTGIEVICINDGSTDSSPSILKEYAAKDARIRIITKPNGGVSSARNAAYEHIQGKYTYFADADDCLDPRLCAKAYYAAEYIQADVCFLFVRMEGAAPVDAINIPLALSAPDMSARSFMLSRINGGPCTKLFRTMFLKENELKFPPYRIGEDQLVHWKACLLAERVSICPEQLYWYRQHPASAMNSGGEKCLDVIDVFERIKEFLVQDNLYDKYEKTFLAVKLDHLYLECHALPKKLSRIRNARLKETLGPDEMEWLSSDVAPIFFQNFFLAQCGSRDAQLRYTLYKIKKNLIFKLGIDTFKKKVRAWCLSKIDLHERDASLCAEIAQLRESEAVVRLNETRGE